MHLSEWYECVREFDVNHAQWQTEWAVEATAISEREDDRLTHEKRCQKNALAANVKDIELEKDDGQERERPEWRTAAMMEKRSASVKYIEKYRGVYKPATIHICEAGHANPTTTEFCLHEGCDATVSDYKMPSNAPTEPKEPEAGAPVDGGRRSRRGGKAAAGNKNAGAAYASKGGGRHTEQRVSPTAHEIAVDKDHCTTAALHTEVARLLGVADQLGNTTPAATDTQHVTTRAKKARANMETLHATLEERREAAKKEAAELAEAESARKKRAEAAKATPAASGGGGTEGGEGDVGSAGLPAKP